MTDRTAGSPGPPDRWLVLRVTEPGDPERTALLSDALVELGGRAVWEKDGRLVTHVPQPDDAAAFVADARRALVEAVAEPGRPAPTVDLETEWQDHEDWAELWKRGLGPRRITDRLVVTPSWCGYDPEPGDLVVTVDPGMAFGNAEHGTTRGCLRLLDRVIDPGDRVLDVGCGSAVLSVAAALLGAVDVLGLEADPWAVDPARENVEANGVGDRVRIEERVATAEELARLDRRSVVVANMEFGVLRPLVPGLAAAVAPDGALILSGVLGEEWEALVALAASHRVAVEQTDADGEWRSGVFRRR